MSKSANCWVVGLVKVELLNDKITNIPQKKKNPSGKAKSLKEASFAISIPRKNNNIKKNSHS